MQHVPQYAPARRPLPRSTPFHPISAEAVERAVQTLEVEPAVKKLEPVCIRRANRHAHGALHDRPRDNYGMLGIQDVPGRALLGGDEQVTVTLAGQVVYAAGTKSAIDDPVELSAGKRYSIEIEYQNPEGRAELKLLWRSRTMDPQRLNKALLYPN